MRQDLLTRWGRALDPASVLAEHPRPQLVRDSHLNLNGWWDYAITPAAAPAPSSYDGRILVPFPPEAPLSGVRRQLQPHERLTYRRDVRLPPGFTRAGHRVLLHLGAVDQTCTVRVNGAVVGEGVGGYWPITCDITEALDGETGELVVEVRDRSDRHQHATGKQRLHRGGIWYTAHSGIWQTVWLESVPQLHVQALDLVPHLADGSVDVTVHGAAGRALVRLAGREVAVDLGRGTRIPVDDVRPWSPADPHLYDVEVLLGEDRVRSYVGMRSVGVEPDRRGVPRLVLNGEARYHAGVLDQGYWPDGLLTAPSDEALVHDVATMKRLGFDVVRKHAKIEPLRWYHHCDRLGMLVWQDLVNGGGRYRTAAVLWPGRVPIRLDDRRWRRALGRGDADGRRLFRDELRRTLGLLHNSPSVVGWVAFNEGWGQFDAADVAAEITHLDPTRLVDHASGWHDQRAGDVRSLHAYGRAFRLPRRRRRDGRAVLLSEYGGHQLRVPGHVLDDEVSVGYGEESTPGELAVWFRRLHDRLAAAVPRGLAGSVYTQLTDVEDELNGLLTYDREVEKLDPVVVRAALDRLRSAAGT